MKNNRFQGIVFLITIIFASLLFFNNDQEQNENNSEHSLNDVINQIGNELREVYPNSSDAKKLTNQINRLRAKAKGKTIHEENPEAIIEAFREIKTAFDGTTYKPNYKNKALAKAGERRSLSKTNSTPLPWVERGPGNVSGRTRQVLVDPDDASGNTWFAATVGGGIWKTTDGGQTWENKTPELTTLSTTCIVMAESNHNVLYAGTGMGFGRLVDLAGSGVWKSTDRGETWFQLASTANNELLAAINRIVVDPNNENIVLVCSNDDYTSYGPNGGERKSGIFKSTDGGTSWQQVYDPDITLGTTTDNRVQQIVANPQNFSTLYASVNEVGVIKSTDAGETWTVSANNFARLQDIGTADGSYQGISTRTELAIASSDTSRLYAAVERRLGTAKLYMTSDAGANWALVNDTGSDPNWFSLFGTSGAAGAYTAGWFDNTIAVSPYDKNVVFVGGVELYRIDVNDVDFTRTTSLIANRAAVHADHHDLKMIPVNQQSNSFRILNANDGGVALSSDGGNTWQEYRGLITTQFYGVDKKPGENVYIGGLQDNGTYLSGTDPNVSSQWTWVIGGDGFETAWNFANPNLVIGNSQNGNYSRSTDGGQTFVPIPNAKAGQFAPFFSKIASSKIDPDLVFTVGSGGVARSDDFGLTWTYTAMNGNWMGWRAFDNVEISIADPQIVWATSPLDFKAFFNTQGGIHVSQDGGLSFTEISQNFPQTVTESSGLATHPYDPNTAYILFSAAGTPKILRTTDLGQSFEDISGFSGAGTNTLNKTNPSENTSNNGYPDVATLSLLVMPYNTDIIWAGTEIGLFVSEDAGKTWHLSDSGIPNVGIFQMFIQDGQVVVATYGRGIWTVDLPELASYTPPLATLSPRLSLIQKTSGDVSVTIDLRSPYDSTGVFVDGSYFETVGPNESATTSEVLIPITEDRTLTANIISYKDGREFKAPVKTVTAFAVQAQFSYVTDFSAPGAANDFTGNGFSITSANGFSDAAIHSAHPYGQAQDFIYQLKIPIRVASNGATLEYDDVALIEEGTSTDWTNANFFDYVVVEGFIDGQNWLPLADGYDSRFDPVWSTAYNSGIDVNFNSQTPGDESMYRSHTINLLDTFNPGDVIFIRFRLSSDPLAVAWGWAIDNLSIQGGVTDVAENNSEIPTSFELEQNYPNPFNPSTTISYQLPVSGQVTLKVFDILGKEVATLVNTQQSAGIYQIEFDASQLTSGVYVYRIDAENFVQTKKMVLLK